MHPLFFRTSVSAFVAPLALLLLSTPAPAASLTGTVSVSGSVLLAQPIAGIAVDDLTVATASEVAATEGGETCTILSSTSDSPDTQGA